jgi:hypothetical protein
MVSRAGLRSSGSIFKLCHCEQHSFGDGAIVTLDLLFPGVSDDIRRNYTRRYGSKAD